jgi:hypothetical protein
MSLFLSRWKDGDACRRSIAVSDFSLCRSVSIVRHQRERIEGGVAHGVRTVHVLSRTAAVPKSFNLNLLTNTHEGHIHFTTASNLFNESDCIHSEQRSRRCWLIQQQNMENYKAESRGTTTRGKMQRLQGCRLHMARNDGGFITAMGLRAHCAEGPSLPGYCTVAPLFSTACGLR